MIGIYGGTFDPVHYGHLRSALEVKESLGLAQIRLIPNSEPPHREQPVATAAQRVHMLELAIHDRAGFIIDTRELDRAGNSFMVDTLRSLRADFPDQPLLLIIGSDAFNGLIFWYRWQQLFDYAHVVVMTRPGFQSKSPDDFLESRTTHDQAQLAQQPFGKLYFQQVTQLDISASSIRRMIAEKRNPDFLLPDAVIKYIHRDKLYKTL